MSLALDAYNVAENDGSVSVCAVLLGGELAREVAVNITTTDTAGTATGACVHNILSQFCSGHVGDIVITSNVHCVHICCHGCLYFHS